MPDFTHLHVHSHYSLLDGLGKINALVEQVKELGMEALALTDHGVMYGVIDFYRCATEAGVKPILGLEAYIAPKGRLNKRGKIDMSPRHITLLAQNNAGYQNLIKLTSKAHLEGYYYKPRIDYELLQEHQEGLVVLSGCMNGDIAKSIINKQEEETKRLIEWHIEVFGRDRFFLEVQHHPSLAGQAIINDALLKYGRQYNLPVVATCDSHYIHPDDAEAQDVLVCVQTGKTVQDKDRLCMLGENYSLKSQAELKEAWKDHPEVIDNTQRITEMCQVDIEFGVNKLPSYPLPAGQTPDNALREICVKRLEEIYEPQLKEAAIKRLDYELGVIAKTGFASYFLIVEDFVNEAKRRGILVGPGRGSAAGSIVSYLTNITGLDPLRYNLLFERFLNPERVSMPDIDLDFADDRRDEVLEYVREKYGRDHVAQIITFGTMAARAAVRDTGRALGFPYAFCDQVAKVIPMFTNFEEALTPNSELKEMYDSDPQVKRLVDTARKLEGVCRHASTHAAGVVITEKPLTDHLPLQLASTSKSEQPQIVTQYAMNHVEALGLLKMDFLGLKNLTIIQNALQYIKATSGEEVDINNLPLEDGLTYQLLQEGKTTGVFQLESSGMKRYLRELKPSEFEDIISMVALYRPGPMDLIPDFINAKHGRRKISYLHPLLKPILEKTYGVIVTQDQVLEIARQFAGFTYAEADILRKAVGKKIRKLLIEQREKFIDGAISKKGIERKTAQQTWDFIEPFARYGFNRAHAACYAMIAYQTAYLKSHWPAEFMAALLTSDEGNTDRQAIEVAEALSMGLKVLPPDINYSGYDFTVVKKRNNRKDIRFGLGAIKNVGRGVVEAVIRERELNGPYKDLFDIFRRVNSKDFNKKSVESMAKVGAFDASGERGQILANTDKLLEFNRTLHRKIDTGQKGLFSTESVLLAEPTVALMPSEAAAKDEFLAWEKDLLGLYLSEHPLSSWHKKLTGFTVPLLELASDFAAGGQVRVAGIIIKITKIITKSAKPMLFVQLEDLTGKTEVLVFPSLLEQTSELWVEGAKLAVQGKLSDKDGEMKILADKVWQLTDALLKDWQQNAPAQMAHKKDVSLKSAQLLVIILPSYLDKVGLERLKAELTNCSSQAKNTKDWLAVELRLKRDGSMQQVKTPYVVPREENVTMKLAKIVGPASLQFR
ncbi:MAG: DNA polymerase III subunit alpha [Candidatus Andersenbacteria bacterium RIFCSPHIGHO2_12_FULL_46_9]|nr:MAG: polymerase III, alpha subunit protein [Parcubacteria group bacterium GW2011_GWA2_45_14]OGY34258.1 MAG: DNA polymerase III subunit alpha [Candidatus Andersenbacteria bacterium RIFCSPHIGHO2_02_FULL_46_16]OGY36089.1 MAG: DNA polymerase III subunit alpha [Candidatus Andersenbacteria bacterium RIFCSPHIGHO2_12_FULL_46_9]